VFQAEMTSHNDPIFSESKMKMREVRQRERDALLLSLQDVSDPWFDSVSKVRNASVTSIANSNHAAYHLTSQLCMADANGEARVLFTPRNMQQHDLNASAESVTLC
jgi:hypothetical protein